MFVPVPAELGRKLGMSKEIADLICTAFDGVNQHPRQFVDDLIGNAAESSGQARTATGNSSKVFAFWVVTRKRCADVLK